MLSKRAKSYGALPSIVSENWWASNVWKVRFPAQMHRKTITWGCEGDADVTGEPRTLCQGKLQAQNRASLRETSHVAELEGQSIPRSLEFRFWLWRCRVWGLLFWVWGLLPLVFSPYPPISHFWIEMVLCTIIRNNVCILEIAKLYFGFTGVIAKR